MSAKLKKERDVQTIAFNLKRHIPADKLIIDLYDTLTGLIRGSKADFFLEILSIGLFAVDEEKHAQAIRDLIREFRKQNPQYIHLLNHSVFGRLSPQASSQEAETPRYTPSTSAQAPQPQVEEKVEEEERVLRPPPSTSPVLELDDMKDDDDDLGQEEDTPTVRRVSSTPAPSSGGGSGKKKNMPMNF